MGDASISDVVIGEHREERTGRNERRDLIIERIEDKLDAFRRNLAVEMDAVDGGGVEELGEETGKGLPVNVTHHDPKCKST